MSVKKSDLSQCPITRTMELIGGKWSLPIVYVLMKDTKRFNELERSIEGINTRMLVKELKRLEQGGIVVRKVYAEVPPKVEYSLTSKGRELKNALETLKFWGEQHIEFEV